MSKKIRVVTKVRSVLRTGLREVMGWKSMTQIRTKHRIKERNVKERMNDKRRDLTLDGLPSPVQIQW